MNKLVGIACALMLLSGGTQAEDKSSLEEIHSRHMLAQAMLTAHFVAAALKARMGREEIDAVLTDIAERSAVTEFHVTDGKGRRVFSNVKETEFTFPTDPDAGTQAAPFARLLDGTKTVVTQKFRPREYDQKVFKYVGVSGVDRIRIVQVGVSALDMGMR